MSFSIFPRAVYRTRSKISGEIEVKDWLGDRTLSVQGMIQSGGLVSSVWKKALPKRASPIFNCLILGLGGGTAVHLIKARWPSAKIIAVEIDPEIIKIGKKYFGLDKVKNLEIINADAIKIINHQPLMINDFNLILVDLYLGKQFPKKAEEDEFLRKVKKLLAKNGVAIFNRLKIDRPEGFKKKLERHFSLVELVCTSTNFFFLVRS